MRRRVKPSSAALAVIAMVAALGLGLPPELKPASASAQPEWIAKARLPVPELEQLPNGLQIAWFLDDRIPVIDMIVLVQSGSRHDPDGKSGTARLMSSVMDRGADGMDAHRLAREIERLGASRYVSADDDSFSVGVHGLAPDATRLLELLHSIALRPEFPEKEVEKERGRLLDAWKHIGDHSNSLASLVYSRVLASGTPYGRGGQRSMAELSRITRDDLIKYHQSRFRPDQAILMVVGRVKKDEFRRKIVETFGSWAPPEGRSGVKESKKKEKIEPARNYSNPELIPAKGEKGVLVHRPDLTQAVVKIGFRAPLLTSPDHYPLSVANALFGELFHSRLNSVIRDQLGLTYGIGSSFSYSKEFGAFTISASTRNEAVGDVIKKAIEILKDLSKAPIPEEEIRKAKDYLIGGFPVGTPTLASAASRWLSGYVFRLGPEYLNEFIPKVESVSAKSVHEAVKRHLSPKDSEIVIVVAGDADRVAPSLKKKGLWPMKRVEIKDLVK